MQVAGQGCSELNSPKTRCNRSNGVQQEVVSRKTAAMPRSRPALPLRADGVRKGGEVRRQRSWRTGYHAERGSSGKRFRTCEHQAPIHALGHAVDVQNERSPLCIFMRVMIEQALILWVDGVQVSTKVCVGTSHEAPKNIHVLINIQDFGRAEREVQDAASFQL